MDMIKQSYVEVTLQYREWVVDGAPQCVSSPYKLHPSVPDQHPTVQSLKLLPALCFVLSLLPMF